jgi:hypothetical protein
MATVESVPQKHDQSSDFLGSANRLRTVANAKNPFVYNSRNSKIEHSVRIEPKAGKASRAAQSSR